MFGSENDIYFSSSSSEEQQLVNRSTLIKHYELFRTADGDETAVDDVTKTANVIFDAPGEYYVKAYYNFPPSVKAITAAHLEAFREKINKQKEKDKASRARAALESQHRRLMFGYLRDFAIDVVERDILNKIDVCQEVNRRAIEPGLNVVEVPHRMFSWDYESYLERRNVGNIVWIELLVMETDERSLEVEKCKMDLCELARLMKLVFQGLRKCHSEDKDDEEKKFDLGTDVLKVIADTYDNMNILQNLTKELQTNRTVFREDINKSISITLGRRDSKDRAVITNLEQTIMSYSLWSPIEVRYQLSHYEIMGKQAEFHVLNKSATYEEQIRWYAEATKRENYCSQCALNTFYTQIEKYKRSISSFQGKYNIEYEAIEGELTVKRMALEKLRETRRHKGEELVRFRREIAKVREHDAEVERQRQWAAAQLELRRAQEALEAEERRKRKARGRKK